MTRHLAWFTIDSGRWIGEWEGDVPAPGSVIHIDNRDGTESIKVMPNAPPSLIGAARLMVLNEWLHQVQRRITPFGAAYEAVAQAWDMDAWDDCPTGGAVCLDVTFYRYPVGDFRWAHFDSVDRRLSFPETHTFLQVTTARAELDTCARSPRPIRAVPTKLVADVTGTPLEPWHDAIRGGFIRRDGRLVFEPSRPGLPEAIVASITERNPAARPLTDLARAAIPAHGETYARR